MAVVAHLLTVFICVTGLAFGVATSPLNDSDVNILLEYFKQVPQYQLNWNQHDEQLSYPAISIQVDAPSTLQRDYSLRVTTLGYERALIIYTGEGLTKDIGCSKFFLPSNLPTACTDLSSGTNYMVLDFNTSYQDITLFTQSADQTVSHTMHLMLYNSLCDNQSSEYLLLPNVVSSSPPFYLLQEGKSCSSRTIDVRLYSSLNITALVTGAERFNCDVVYVQIGTTKICVEKDQHASIDVHNINDIKIQSFGSSSRLNELEFLLKLEGVREDNSNIYDICASSRSELTESIGTVVSPGYPHGVKYELSCEITIEKQDVVDIELTFPDLTKQENICEYQDLYVNGEEICEPQSAITKFTFYPSQSISVQLMTEGGQPSKGWSLKYHAYSYANICSMHNQIVTDLPLRLKSPNFPNHYSKHDCFVHINSTTSRVNITLRYLALEESNSCSEDFIQISSISNNTGRICKAEDQGKVLQFGKGLFTVHFRTDLSGANGGFLIDVEDGNPPLSTTTTTTIVSTTTVKPSDPETKTTQGTTLKPSGGSSKQTPKVSTSTSSATTVSTTKVSSTMKPSSGPEQKTTQGKTTIKPSAGSDKQTSDSHQDSYTGLYVGLAVGVVALVIVVAILVIWRKRRTRGTQFGAAFDDVGFENPTYGEEPMVTIGISE